MAELRKIINHFFTAFLGLVMYSCHIAPSSQHSQSYKSELFAVEKEFCSMAQTKGIQMAFVYFAADSAVILRGNKILKGKEGIRQYYNSMPDSRVKLEWAPDFADVSASGDLGYTYGKYRYTAVDSVGHSTQSEGVFHTVWKRQSNGEWRFVWD